MAKNPKPPQGDADIMSDGVQRRVAPPSYSFRSTGSISKDGGNSHKPVTRSHTILVRQCSPFCSYFVMARTAVMVPVSFKCTLLTIPDVLRYEEAQEEK
jgi:hypothetical protein